MDIGNAKCPDCGKSMTPVTCECKYCDIRMEGNFTVSILSQLSSTDQALVIAFVRSYGSIKKIQKLLDVSYPTARVRIADLIKRLDSTMEVTENMESQILEKLERGDISFSEAMEEL